jgi:hypothetical protein
MTEHKEGVASVAMPYRLTHQEQFEQFRELVERVARTYIDCREAQPLNAASGVDPAMPRRGKTAATVHFIVDVQHAVESVANPEERAAVIRLFVHAADGFPKIGPFERRAIWRLGSALKRRGLNPTRYFVACHHPEHHGISAIPDSAFLATATTMATEVQ